MEDIPGIGDAAPAAPADSSDATSALPGRFFCARAPLVCRERAS